MKRNLQLSILFSLMLMLISVIRVTPTFAQESTVTHDSILAAIPDMSHFEAQAAQTFVGDVEGSYAYIAFVVQDNLVIIYVCDGYDASAWIRAEVVNGEIHVTHEETGIQVDATVTAEGIVGTIVLTTDDDDTAAATHAFSTVPAVPGETGLARYADEFEVGGWIVTAEGVRGIKKAIQCAGYRRQVESMRQLMNNTSDAAVRDQLAGQIIDTNIDAIIAGCDNVST